MINSSSYSALMGSLQFSIDKNTSTKKISEFLDTCLPGYLLDLTADLSHEDDLSQELSIFLNREAIGTRMFMFHFQHKYIGSNRSSDLSVISAERYATKEPIYVIEAKRLPTPGSGREKEYVKGNSGGIERFKRGLHGAKLTASAMIGYIQANDFIHWHRLVNSWISELVSELDQSIKWENSEFLTQIGYIESNVFKLRSVHGKLDNTSIDLSHYWLNLHRDLKQ